MQHDCPCNHSGISYETGVGGYWQIEYCKSCGKEISRVWFADKMSEY